MIHPKLEQWAAEGNYISIEPHQHKVFYKQYGNENAAPQKTLLLLHGFPESSYSYHKIVDGMMEIFDRVVLFDMIGYGLSDKPVENYTYSLIVEQADVALQVWEYLGVKGGHLLSHDMGDSVATELATRHQRNLLPTWFSVGFQSFTFTNGSMVIEFAKLRITQKILLSKRGHWLSKLFTEQLFKQQVESAHGNTNLSEKDIKLLWNNIIQQDGHRKNHLMMRYYKDRIRFEQARWLPNLAQVTLPIHLCWGDEDNVAKIVMAKYLKQNICKDATLTIMKGVGHFCQLGSPDIWIKSVGDFYKKMV